MLYNICLNAGIHLRCVMIYFLEVINYRLLLWMDFVIWNSVLSEELVNIFKRVCLEPKTFASIVNSSLFAAFMAVLHAREQCQEQKPTPEVQLHRMLNKINVNVDPLKSWKTNTWPTDNRYACASVAFGMNLVTNGGFKKGIGATHLFFCLK